MPLPTLTSLPAPSPKLPTVPKPDPKEFAAIVASHRGRLLAHCYRFTGSLHDAEDLVQETVLRAWRSLDRFEGRASLASWLCRIATNVCLTAMQRQANSRRVFPDALAASTLQMPTRGPATGEVTWIEPCPNAILENLTDAAPGPAARYEQQETIRLAFIAATQQLPSRQRAVLLLCDVLGWTAREAGETLEVSVAAVNSALQRARTTMEKGFSAEEIRPESDEVGQSRSIAQQYADAWERTDVEELIALLSRDASLVMPPFREWYQGPNAIRSFLNWYFAWSWNGGHPGVFRLIPTRANGDFAFGAYARLRPQRSFQARSLHVLSFRQGKIHRLMIFVDPTGFRHFGLPSELDLQGKLPMEDPACRRRFDCAVPNTPSPRSSRDSSVPP